MHLPTFARLPNDKSQSTSIISSHFTLLQWKPIFQHLYIRNTLWNKTALVSKFCGSQYTENEVYFFIQFRTKHGSLHSNCFCISSVFHAATHGHAKAALVTSCNPQTRIFLLQVSWKICVQFWHTCRGFLQPFPSNAASSLLATDRCIKSSDLRLTSVFCTLPAVHFRLFQRA